jgi:renal tumor antigen
MRKYRLVAKKGEGTFSEVLKAQNVKDGKYHAIKCMKNHFDSIDQVNNLREIQALRRLSPHQHIITLEEVLYDQPTGRLALVFELMDANLYELIRGRRHYLNTGLVRSYMFQLVRALHHMHRKGIFHRDIKPENILIENTSEMGRGLKLADFGSCRGIYSKQPYTEYISTRWYRAPECLLTDGYYGPEMDIWGAGCVFFEITSLYPLFPGNNELDQINRIHKVLGTPSPELLAKFKRNGAAHVNFDFPEQTGIGITQLIPHATPECTELMIKMLAYDGSDRMSAREGLQHSYFKEIRELEARRQANHGGNGNDLAGVTGGSDTVKSDKGLPVISGNVDDGGGGGGGARQSKVNQTKNTQKSVAKASYLQAEEEAILPPIGQNNTGKLANAYSGSSKLGGKKKKKKMASSFGDNGSKSGAYAAPSMSSKALGGKANDKSRRR